MQEILDSVRRSFAFPPPAGDESSAGTLVDKIRRSRVFSKPSKSSSSPTAASSSVSPLPIRWRKGDLIGCGAFGRVYMGMNLDSGELLAVKEVSIASNHASREKAQAHIKELEEEVNLLKNLSHPNIVRYLGTVREEDSLNILLEFVPGGSISSLLGEFGPFPESVIKSYTKQLLLGLEYLHKSDIMHRDIKGANILVDNTGCIKLADFGASKKVVALATISGAKSMKGTPYWMAPEVILQTGHSFPADIWSVGCTIIEMATGKPPWSEQYQEVAALFHIGTTKSHPPIPEHLSAEAKDFLLRCLQKEPNLRPVSSELHQHPFVTGERSTPVLEFDGPTMDPSEVLSTSQKNRDFLQSCSSVDVFGGSEHRGETRYIDDEMCLIDDKEKISLKLESALVDDVDLNQSFNPMSDPFGVWSCNIDRCHELEQIKGDTDGLSMNEHTRISLAFRRANDDSSSPYCPSSSEEDDDLTKSKIKAFLDEKVIELKKLQTPLYEEFLNTLNGSYSPSLLEGLNTLNDSSTIFLKLPPRSRSPGQLPCGSPCAVVECGDTASPTRYSRCLSNISNTSNQTSPDVTPPQYKEQRALHVDGQQDSNSPSMSFSERQKKWKEELDEELARQREIMRQSGVVGKTSSPIDRALHRQKERSRFASPAR